MVLIGRPASELAELVHNGETSARAIVEAHLDHLAAVESRLGAFVSVRREAAIAQARAVDEREDKDRLPLAGVPVAVSDVIDVAGSPTRAGSAVTASDAAVADDDTVAALVAAGAVVMGKARVSELGGWGTADDPDGTAVSPWDASRSAGGSSGGAAAAVAAGVAPIALGIDALGSVRGPASACGLVGARPGAGHLGVGEDSPQHWFGMGRYGVLATTVRDVALTLHVLDGEVTAARPMAPNSGLRVAVSWKAPSPGVVVAGSWREAAIEAGRLLHHTGHEVVHRDPPYDRGVTQAVVSRWTQGVGADARVLDVAVDELQPRTRAHIAAGERMARRSPIEADDASSWREKLAAFFEEVDVIVTPSLARMQPAASSWHTRPWAANIAVNLSSYPFFSPWNLADVPTMSVPMWHDAGRPLSVQLITAAGNEDRLLAVAAALEGLVPWKRHAPGWGLEAREAQRAEDSPE